MSRAYVNRGKDKTNVVKSQIFNIDNGSGTTVDETIMLSVRPVKLISAYAVEDTETAGLDAAGTIQLGTSVAGADVIAATPYTPSIAVGVAMPLALLVTVLPAGQMLVVRHTGVVATPILGQAHLQLEYQEM